MKTEEVVQNIQNVKENEVFRFGDYKDKFKKMEEDIKFYFTYKDYQRIMKNEQQKMSKHGLRVTLYTIILMIVIYLLEGLDGTMFSIIFFGWFIYIAILLLIRKGFSANEKDYQKKLNEKICAMIYSEYKSRLPIINYMPDDTKYNVIGMLEVVSGGTYDDAKNQLVLEAYDVEADAIVNLQHQISNKTYTSAKTSVSGRTATTSVTTDTQETHYLKGMAIKIL